jgi:hypothetical protein
MAIAEFVLDMLDKQEALVLRIEDPQVTLLAKKIAFYSAMIDAAVSEPDEDDIDQREFLELFRQRHTELVETYQALVNDHM